MNRELLANLFVLYFLLNLNPDGRYGISSHTPKVEACERRTGCGLFARGIIAQMTYAD